MKLLDLFCGAGGAGMGYHRAGFEVVGVDHLPQKNYPFEFHQADVLEYLAEHGSEFDVIHASPPCQAFTNLRFIHGKNYPDMIDATRDLLVLSGKYYVIENVRGAKLNASLMLCGTMFPELRVIRHRYFETYPILAFPPAQCDHWGTVSGNAAWNEAGRVTPSLKLYDFLTVTGNDYIADDGRKAMQIDWMTKKELSQAIPPAYTEFIGRMIMEANKP